LGRILLLRRVRQLAAALVLPGLVGCGESRSGGEGEGSATPGPDPSDGQGFCRIVPSDPVTVSTFGCWIVEWVAGPSGLGEGGGAVLQVSPFWGWSPPQTVRPGSAGYTTVSSSRPGVEVSIEDGGVPMAVVARLLRGRLEPGDTLRFAYGDSSVGGIGSLSRADRYAEDFEELLIKTDGNGDGFFVAPADQPSLTLLPRPAEQLTLAATATAEPGETIDVAVHGLDALGNRTDLPPGQWVLRARPLAGAGAPTPRAPDTLAAGRTDVPADGARADIRLEGPGLFRLEAVHRTEAGAIVGANDVLLVERDSPFGAILWGDIHCHSALSDGTGAPEDLYAYARDVAGLDVCVVTDHDAHGLFPLAERGGWERLRAAAQDAYIPGRFVTLLGYEWTSWTFGHRNVYYPSLDGEVFAFLDGASDTPEELWQRIAPFGGMTIPHHPGGGPVPVDWSVPSLEERETVVEICSIHGSSEAVGMERGIYRPVEEGMVRAALDRGHELGILAAGDTHDGHPGRRTAGAPANGLAAFRTADASREGVWAALRERRVYGTSGPRILLATDWDGERPGTKLARAPSGPLVVEVCAPEPIEVVEIVGSGGTLASSRGGGRRAQKRFFEDGGAPASGWLYVRVVLGDGEQAWDSPYWIRGEGS
jgi:hypothetical protein